VPEEDFHLSDQMRFQAHEEAASCRFANVQSQDRVLLLDGDGVRDEDSWYAHWYATARNS